MAVDEIAEAVEAALDELERTTASLRTALAEYRRTTQSQPAPRQEAT